MLFTSLMKRDSDIFNKYNIFCRIYQFLTLKNKFYTCDFLSVFFLVLSNNNYYFIISIKKENTIFGNFNS